MRSLVSQISIHKLEVFCLVAELSSISRAAERLGIAQPVVSGHVKAMSQKFGTPLTARQGRRVALTDAGKRVHVWAREVVSRTMELEREMSESQRGVIGKANVGASMTLGSYVLPALIADFHDQYPKGEISVRVTTPKLVTDAVHSGDCDFAFSILDPRHETAGLEIEPVATEQLILVGSQDFSLKDDMLSLKAFADLPFISAQSGTPRREIEDHLLRQLGVQRTRIEMEFGHAESIKQAVRAGAGVAFLFKSSVYDELASGMLREIKIAEMQLGVQIYQIRRKGKKLSRFQLSLMHALARAISTEPALLVGPRPSAQEPERSDRTIAGE